MESHQSNGGHFREKQAKHAGTVMGKGSPHAEHKCMSFTTLLYISHACHYQILPISFMSFFLLGRKKKLVLTVRGSEVA